MHKLFYNDRAMRIHLFSKNSKIQTAREIGLIDVFGLTFSVSKEIKDLAAEIDGKDGLSVTYQHREGYPIVNQMILHDALILEQIFTERAKATNIEIRKTVTLAKFENLIAHYNALRCIAEKEYEEFMNNTLWYKIIQPLTKHEHSQFELVAFSCATMVDVNKEM